ncbi:MAG: DinB family protein [Armatimonadetes bacterium]|nr:DinB family protein [Armatimonadota bacterium]
MSVELARTYQICAEHTAYLLDQLSEEQLDVKLPKGQGVRATFRHIYTVRRMWLEQFNKAKWSEALPKWDKNYKVTTEDLRQALEVSKQAWIEEFTNWEPDKKKSSKSASDQLGYLVAHESYHWAMIEIALRHAECELSQSQSYSLWEWGKTRNR